MSIEETLEGLLSLEAETEGAEAGRLPPSLRPTYISGCYAGPMVSPLPARLAMELRIDVDRRGRHSPVLDRVSGDVFDYNEIKLPGRPPTTSRTYRASWIIEQPVVKRVVVHGAIIVTITGSVRYWKGVHLATTATITIRKPLLGAATPAEVVFQTVGAAPVRFECKRVSDSFRQVNLEIDIAGSVGNTPPLPDYRTHAHPTRPANLEDRTLTIERTYFDAGVEVAINPNHTVINDGAMAPGGWTPAELHDAMEAGFNRINGSWPSWNLWGFLATEFEDPGVGGIMFDAAAAYGGAGRSPERQGFAVFRNHPWFANLNSNEAVARAAAMRHYLYTWVHEAGHAFNFLHSWNKGRPDSLSFMNYDWRYDQRNGPNAFWSNFMMTFDLEELMHLRHGDRAAVIMGGDAWASGGHLETPSALSAVTEGHPPLEVTVRSRGYFELLEPVAVEVRVRNLLPDVRIAVDTRFDPAYGAIGVFIQRPDGHVDLFDPPYCLLGNPVNQVLEPAGASQGTERYSGQVWLNFGRHGHTFTNPGTYLIRVGYHAPGDVIVWSAPHAIRIGAPLSRDEDRLAQDVFTDVTGRALVYRGGQSPLLAKGRDTLREIMARLPGSMAAAKAADALAVGLSRPHHTVVGTEVKKAAEAAPREALELYAKAKEAISKDPALNIAYSKIVQREARLLAATGEAAKGKQAVDALRKDLDKRGVNPPVLQDLAAFAKRL